MISPEMNVIKVISTVFTRIEFLLKILFLKKENRNRKLKIMLSNIDDFEPNSPEEKEFVEAHSSLSKATSKMLRAMPKNQRLSALKQAEPTDVSLLALYLWANHQEDYETCQVAKELIEERKIPISNWP